MSRLMIIGALMTMAAGCTGGTTGSSKGTPSNDRADSERRAIEVIAAIEAHNAAMGADERQSKYCRMAESPYRLFRGTNHLFWRDLAADPRMSRFGGERTRIFVQGDLHADNMGSFDDDEGNVVYDLNDFDEAVIADYQWDVWRMATSIALAAGELGYGEASSHRFIDAFTESYLDTLAGYRGNDRELGAAFTEATTYGLLDDFLRDVESSESRKDMLSKWTDKDDDDVRRFDFSHDELAAVDADIAAELLGGMPSYIGTTRGKLAKIPGYFTVQDVARRLDAGTGSLGTPRYYLLIQGESTDPDDDRILDVKRQGEPSAYPYLGAAEKSLLAAAASSQGERAVVGYRALLANADDHLGWLVLPSGHYSVRERSPYKETFGLDALTTDVRFTKLAEQWGAVVATAHARADKDHRADLIPYSFDREVDELTGGRHDQVRALAGEVALGYAATVHRDHAAFVAFVTARGLCAR